MKHLFVIVLSISTVVTTTQPLQAQSAQTQKSSANKRANSAKQKPAEKSARELAFQRVDANRDGKIDSEEFLDGSVGKAAESKRQEFAEFDLSKDGSLDSEEFKKRGNKPPDRTKLTDDFKQRDKDRSGNLSQKEFVGNRVGTELNNAKTTFLKLDIDGNDQVSQEEFVERGGKKKASTKSAFRQLDTNADKKLTEAEFMRPRVGKKWEQAGRDNFKKYELNGDKFLSESEFAIMPSQKPDPETMFRGLDVSQNGSLTSAELTRLMANNPADLAERTFANHDKDGNGELSLDEYLARQSSIASQRSRRAWLRWLDLWGMRALIGLDALLLLLAARWVYRRFARPAGQRAARPPVAAAT